MTTRIAPAPHGTPAWIAEVLGYEAPYLERKLLQERIVASAGEARSLFAEVKRYLVLCALDDARAYSIPSLRVDEVWHQFVLFTSEYAAFCRRFFGTIMHHAPSNAPAGAGGKPTASDEDRADAYRAAFGEAPPEIWRDELSVTVNRRLALDPKLQGSLAVRVAGGRAELVHAVAGEEEPCVRLRIDAWGAPALAWIVGTGAFFVRELPAPLEADDKIALCRVLVAEKILGVAR